jgi:gliding motility-associated-like protein
MKKNNSLLRKITLYSKMENFLYSPKTGIMSNFILKLKLISFFIFTLFCTNQLQASHLMGADITYREIDSNIGRYRITVSLYRDCVGVGLGVAQLIIRTSSISTTIPMDVLSVKEATPICFPPDVAVKPATNCPSGPVGLYKGVMQHIFTKDVILGKNVGWALLGVADFCRNSAISTINPTCEGLFVQCVINTNYRNSSPVFTTMPIPYWCKLRVNTYNHGTVDSVDPYLITLSNGLKVVRDSLVYRLYSPFTNMATNINNAVNYMNPTVNFISPLNFTNFLWTSTGVQVNSRTGTITCFPTIEQDAIMAMSVQEWRAVPNGATGYSRVMIGYVTRDLQFTVRNTCPPVVPQGVTEDSLKSANKINFSTVDVCGSKFTQINFKITGAPQEFLKYKIIELPDSANVYNFKYNINIDRKNNTDTMDVRLTFDSTLGIGTSYFKIEAFYCSNIGMRVSEFYTLIINFRPSVTTHKQFLYYCIGGKPVRSYARGGTKYRWTPQTGIVKVSGTDSSWVDLAPAVSTSYVARATDGIDSTKSCSVLDSVRVIVIPKFNYTLAPKVSNLCLHDTVQLNLSTQISDTPYKYLWMDPTSIGSLYHPTTNKRSTTIASPKIVVTSSGTYVVEITSRFDCTLTDSVRINMNGVRPVASGLSARNILCPGDTTMLSVTVKPKTCGPSIYSCARTPTLQTVTAGISSIFPSAGACSGACYPNPFNTTGAGQSSSSRFIYTKAELNAAGVRAGVIKSIAFNISEVNTPTFDKFEVRMAGTTLTNSTAFNAPMFTIFGPASKTVTTGWDPSTKFTIPGNGFDWDGESNIIIETHASTTAFQLVGNKMRVFGTVAGNTTSYKLSSTLGVAAENAPGSYSSVAGVANKPQLQIEFCTVDSTPTNILNAVWQPSAFITNVSNPRAIGRVTQKDSVFIATVGTGLCNDTALVRINLDQSFKVTVNPGKRVYCVTGATPPNVNLSATVTGGAGTTMNWTAIPSAGAGMPGTTNIPNITVTPSVGVWKYVISAANGPCNATDTVTITVQPNIPLSLKIDSSLCLASNGKIKAILPGGTIADSFNFVWKKNGTTIAGANKDSIISLAPDNYSLDISLKSDATCTGASAGVLSAKMDTITANVQTSGISCNGFTADSLWAVVTSTTGSGNFKYNWSPGVAADTFYKVINKLAGVYNLTITDRITGCMGRKTFNHTEPTPLVVNLVMKKDILCKGDKNGEIHVLGAGGAGSYSYQWSGINPLNAPIPNFNQLVPIFADSLCVTVTDINNCTVSACYNIIEPTKSLTIDSLRRVCATTVGGSDGTATAYISGGTANFNYKWQTSNGTPVNGAAGTTIPTTNHTTPPTLNKQMYSVTVTDQNGCRDIDSIMLCDIICNMKAAFRTDSVRCFGASTGALHFAAIDSLNYPTTTFYRYTLSNGKDTQYNNHWATDTARFLNLGFGVYSVRVRTSKGCDTTFYNMPIYQNPPFQTTYRSVKESCYGLRDGQLHISVTATPGLGLNPPFSYNFGSGFISDSFKLTMRDTTGTMIVRDGLGCQQPVGYIVDRPDTIAVTTQPIQMRCKDSLTVGQFEIVVIPTNPDSLGNFRFYNKPGIGLRAPDTMDKFMDSINVAGSKTVTIIYQNLNSTGKRCTYTHNFNVTEPDPIVLSLVQADNPTCSYNFDGKFDVRLNAGQRGNILTGSEKHTYSLSKLNNFVNVDSNSTFSYVFNNLDSGAFTLKVSDPKGCTHSFNHTLIKPDTFKVGFSLPRDANCIEVANGNINVTSFTGGNGPGLLGYQYQWFMDDMLNGTKVERTDLANQNPANGLRGLAKYEVLVKDANGCEARRETIIDTMYQLRIKKVTVDSADCFGAADGSITINTIHPDTIPMTSFTYLFSDGKTTNPNTGLLAGIYNYTVTDAVGCRTTGVSNVYEPADIVAIGLVKPATCNALNGPADGSVKLTSISGGTPPYNTPVWNVAPNQQFTDSAVGLAAGTHVVVITDAKGCSKPFNFKVEEPKPLIASVDRVKHITCFAADDGEIDIKTVGGFPDLKFNWSHGLPNSPNQKNLKPGIDNNLYTVTVTDANGCTTTTGSEIKEPRKLRFDSKIDSVTCPKYKDGIINIMADGGTITTQQGYEYSIDGGTTYFSSSKFTNLAGKDYNVFVRDNNGCVAGQKKTVFEPDEPFFTAMKDSAAKDTLTMGNQLRLYYTPLKTITGFEYTAKGINWSPGMALSCTDCAQPKASPYTTTLYEVELIYHNQCKIKSKINVPVYDPLDFFVPSAFSPGNGDGLNDKLYVYGNGIKKISLIVFNRWGEKVYESDHITTGWDGIYKNEPQPSGVYSFSAEVEYLNGEKRTKKGSVTLIR